MEKIYNKWYRNAQRAQQRHKADIPVLETIRDNSLKVVREANKLLRRKKQTKNPDK